MAYTIYVTVFYPNPEDPGAPIPAGGVPVYVYDCGSGLTDSYTTETNGTVYPAIELPDGVFIIYSEKDTYKSARVQVTDGFPSSISLYLEEAKDPIQRLRDWWNSLSTAGKVATGITAVASVAGVIIFGKEWRRKL